MYVSIALTLRDGGITACIPDWLLSNTTGRSPGGAAHTRHGATHQPQAHVGSLCT